MNGFTRFSFPPRWHYDVLRGLDYFRRQAASHDKRLQDAIALVEKTRPTNGRWALRNRHKGKEFFQLKRSASQADGIRYARCAS